MKAVFASPKKTSLELRMNLLFLNSTLDPLNDSPTKNSPFVPIWKFDELISSLLFDPLMYSSADPNLKPDELIENAPDPLPSNRM